jgi:hypothetical protein
MNWTGSLKGTARSRLSEITVTGGKNIREQVFCLFQLTVILENGYSVSQVQLSQ